MYKLYTAPKPLPSNLSKDIKKTGCGYAGVEPLVCCPSPEERPKSFRREITTEKPWIWDSDTGSIRPTPQNLANRLQYEENRQLNWDYYNFQHPNDFHHFDDKTYADKQFYNRKTKKFYFFDFEDPRTFRNCPPKFSHDFDIPPHFQHVKPFKNFHPMRIPSDGIDPNTMKNMINPNQSNGPKIVFTNQHEITTKPPTLAKRVNKVRLDKLKLINTQNCGISINPRIIGGDDAAPSQFPW